MTEPASSTSPSSGATPGWVEEPGIGKALASGVVIGVVAAFLGTAAVMLVAGQSIGATLGMGAFVAVWGGLGFGGMVGGVVWASRLEAQAVHDHTAAAPDAGDPLRPTS